MGQFLPLLECNPLSLCFFFFHIPCSISILFIYKYWYQIIAWMSWPNNGSWTLGQTFLLAMLQMLISFFFIKTGVSAETLLLINWLTKVMNCAKSWAVVSVEFIAFPLLNTSHAYLLRSYSGHPLLQIGLSFHLLICIWKESCRIEIDPVGLHNGCLAFEALGAVLILPTF